MRTLEQIREAMEQAHARDLRMLPSVPSVVRPGSYGTFPETIDGSAPEAPTLDNGPLYTGEWREEVNGQTILVPPLSLSASAPATVLATLRRPWPWIGFSIMVRNLAPGDTVTAGVNAITRSGRSVLIANLLGGTALGSTAQMMIVIPPATAPAAPAIGMTGLLAGVRVELWVTHNHTETGVEMKGDLWGYNAPGFGP